jgi:hypothetical protein
LVGVTEIPVLIPSLPRPFATGARQGVTVTSPLAGPNSADPNDPAKVARDQRQSQCQILARN